MPILVYSYSQTSDTKAGEEEGLGAVKRMFVMIRFNKITFFFV